MAGRSAHPATGDTTELMGSVLRLLDDERLAYLYTELLKHGEWTTTQELVDSSGIPESTVYDALTELRETPLVTTEEDGRQRRYRAHPFQLGVLSQGEITTLTPTTLAAVGQQVVDEDVEAFVDEHGVDKLIRVVEYVKPYLDGRMSERLAARELDLPAVIGITILVALKETIETMRDVDPYYESIRDASEAGPPTADDGPVEVQYDETTRIVIEPAEQNDEETNQTPTETDADR